MPLIMALSCLRNPGRSTELIAAPTWDAASWDLRVRYYKADGSVDAVDFASAAIQSLGPVLLLQPIQSNAHDAIHLRLSGKVPVLRRMVSDLNELSQAISEAIEAFNSGEPTISLDLAVALMLMHKLDNNHKWAGNAKSYMWGDDLGKGRGFEEEYVPRLPQVLRVLQNAEILVYKLSKSKRKYALNPDMRAQIHDMMRTRRFPEAVQHGLLANGGRVSVRVIDHCIAEQAPDR
ncbi:hypothetical protein [Stenotrophomonas maltophilia]